MTSPDDEYRQLAGLLDSDPDNLALIADTAAAAHAARRFDEAAALLERHESAGSPLPPELRNLAGLLAMARREWGAAAAAFEGLGAAGEDAPAVRFNLAWSLAMDGRGDEALALLDADVVAEIAQAAQLRVGLLHERGRMEEAEAAAREASRPLSRSPGPERRRLHPGDRPRGPRPRPHRRRAGRRPSRGAGHARNAGSWARTTQSDGRTAVRPGARGRSGLAARAGRARPGGARRQRFECGRS